MSKTHVHEQALIILSFAHHIARLPALLSDCKTREEGMKENILPHAARLLKYVSRRCRYSAAPAPGFSQGSSPRHKSAVNMADETLREMKEAAPVGSSRYQQLLLVSQVMRDSTRDLRRAKEPMGALL
ncbi:hypothetical protein NDU88_003566 [Pleurodeles waltl]|uniref:Uncharacterized protein n=1 Tax=Pleurodeles waltl TaxID=8319 RepID=A0AAV7WPT0_PLEWA|nr:hypothetical protein NDU88_003566 [Pleurodeles waltl]